MMGSGVSTLLPRLALVVAPAVPGAAPTDCDVFVVGSGAAAVDEEAAAGGGGGGSEGKGPPPTDTSVVSNPGTMVVASK